MMLKMTLMIQNEHSVVKGHFFQRLKLSCPKLLREEKKTTPNTTVQDGACSITTRSSNTRYQLRFPFPMMICSTQVEECSLKDLAQSVEL